MDISLFFQQHNIDPFLIISFTDPVHYKKSYQHVMYLKHTAYLFIAKLCQSLMGFVSFARLHGLSINAVQPLL